MASSRFLINCYDCRQRQVWLETLHWERHVLSKRRFLTGKQHLVEQVIVNPDFIYRDIGDPQKENYYARVFAHLSNDFLKVVVDFSQGDHGFVVTAFPTNKPKSGETLLWMP